jgi:hypothetical protein
LRGAPICNGTSDHVRACTGEYADAWSRIAETLRWLESLKLTRYQLAGNMFLGMLLLDLGLNAECAKHSKLAIQLADDAGITFWRMRLEANLAIAHMRLGDYSVRPALKAALQKAVENAERHQMIRCLEALTELAFRRGEHEECIKLADELGTHAAASGLREYAARSFRWRGEALAAIGDRDTGIDQLAVATERAKEIGRPHLEWEASHAHAALTGNPQFRMRADRLFTEIARGLRPSDRRTAISASSSGDAA